MTEICTSCVWHIVLSESVWRWLTLVVSMLVPTSKRVLVRGWVVHGRGTGPRRGRRPVSPSHRGSNTRLVDNVDDAGNNTQVDEVLKNGGTFLGVAVKYVQSCILAELQIFNFF